MDRYLSIMRPFRAIMALAIATSLVLLPIGALAFSDIAISSGDAHFSVKMTASTDVSMDCCPDDVVGKPGRLSANKCGMAVCCVGGMVALADLGAVTFRFLHTAATVVAMPVDQFVPVSDGSPPHRPPRV